MKDSAARLFARYYKSERERSEQSLIDILDILIGTQSDEEKIDAAMNRLECHWGRYGEPGSLAPLGNALADGNHGDIHWLKPGEMP